MKKILITGITGQIGSYLADIGLEKGYEIHGMIRRSSSFNTGRIDHIYDKIHLYYGDITDSLSVDKILNDVKPDIIFNMAAQSHVQVSYTQPLYTGNVDAIGNLIILESMKRIVPGSRILQASTSELYGKVLETPQNEKTQFNPVSPYAVAKMYAFYMTKVYRESYGLFACNSICFNNESPRRGETFVTKKITNGLSKWLKEREPIRLGNLNAKRDWGYSREYAEAMYKIVEHDVPMDFVIATGESHSIREFIKESCKYINVDIEWVGEDTNEKGIDKKSGSVIIEVDPKHFRPSEVETLLGDATKAKNVLGWEPKTKFKDIVKIMMLNDIKLYLK